MKEKSQCTSGFVWISCAVAVVGSHGIGHDWALLGFTDDDLLLLKGRWEIFFGTLKGNLVPVLY